MITALLIIIAHYVSDFIFQDEKWATGKSTSIKSLLSHTIVYSLLMTVYIFFIGDFNIPATLLFGLITFILHTVTDYFTSKVVSKKFAAGHYGSSIPNFGAFSVIGFDQVLHYIQLFLTFEVLFN